MVGGTFFSPPAMTLQLIKKASKFKRKRRTGESAILAIQSASAAMSQLILASIHTKLDGKALHVPLPNLILIWTRPFCLHLIR